MIGTFFVCKRFCERNVWHVFYVISRCCLSVDRSELTKKIRLALAQPKSFTKKTSCVYATVFEFLGREKSNTLLQLLESHASSVTFVTKRKLVSHCMACGYFVGVLKPQCFFLKETNYVFGLLSISDLVVVE